jgi:hypothetical protein
MGYQDGKAQVVQAMEITEKHKTPFRFPGMGFFYVIIICLDYLNLHVDMNKDLMILAII